MTVKTARLRNKLVTSYNLDDEGKEKAFFLSETTESNLV